MAVLTDMVASSLFEKHKTLLNWTTYHGIYIYNGIVVMKGKKILQEILNWFAEFQQTVYKASDNQHLQFTAEIQTNDENLNLPEKRDKVQIVNKKEIPFLDMKMR